MASKFEERAYFSEITHQKEKKNYTCEDSAATPHDFE